MSFFRLRLSGGLFLSDPCPYSGHERDRLIAGVEELC
jgi:hypothetical protein